MSRSPDPPTLIPFGPFEANLSSQELRKQGVRLRLPRQSFQILKMLLERPGELVTREELRAALWPADTFVDFEHGLNAAINRLRETLGDEADNPRFVETLPRRGYRFIGPVATASLPQDVQPELIAQPSQSTHLSEQPSTSPGVQPVRPSRWPRVLVGFAALAVLVMAAVLVGHFRKTKKLTDKDPIVMADFENTTGDPVFDDTLRQGLIVQLEQSPYLNVVQESTIDSTLRFMGRKPSDRLSKDAWHEVCERSNSTTLLTGSIARLGSQYVIGLNAEECKTGRHLADEQVQVGSKEDVLKGLGIATSSLRKKLGENLASLQKFDVPLEQVTTPSLEALQAYTRGQKTFDENGYTASIPLFQRAIELDPNFAMAYEFLAQAHFNFGRADLAKPAMQKAFALKDHASERERLLISAIYYGWVTGERQRYIETLQLLAQTYPRASVAHLLLAVEYSDQGQWNDAINEEYQALRLDRPSAVDYQQLARCYFRSGQPDLAEKALQEGSTHYPDVVYYQGVSFELAFFRGDTPRMQQALTRVIGKDYEPVILEMQADADAYYGRMARSRLSSNRAIQLDAKAGSLSSVAFRESLAAKREAEIGNAILAHQHVISALNQNPDGFALAISAQVLAMIGEFDKAESLCRSVQKANAANAYLRDDWLPLVRAQIEIGRNHSAAALTALESTRTWDLGGGRLYPTYLRAQAYLLAHDGDAAALQFQKIIDHPTLIGNLPHGALAHLGLARAYVLQGNNSKAIDAYQDFLTLWKDADPDIPLFKQAKAEFETLH
jgi:DNA-binding winged helix-turn-helix (wHTH) protein/tetratricopeptide (TPR) repeat protein